MSLGVRIKIDADSGVLPALAKLALERDDKTALLDEIGVNLTENARLRFGDQLSPDGQKWQPSLRAKLQGGETLRDTGRLMASLTHKVNGESVEYGTNVDYAPYLHFGAQIKAVDGAYLNFKVPGGGWVNKKSVVLPARPFLGLSTEDEETVINVIGSFLKVQRTNQ